MSANISTAQESLRENPSALTSLEKGLKKTFLYKDKLFIMAAMYFLSDFLLDLLSVEHLLHTFVKMQLAKFGHTAHPLQW